MPRWRGLEPFYFWQNKPPLPAEVQLQNKCGALGRGGGEQGPSGRHQSQLSLSQTSRRSVKDSWLVLVIPICREWKHPSAALMWCFGMFAEYWSLHPGYCRETVKACLVLRLLPLAVCLMRTKDVSGGSVKLWGWGWRLQGPRCLFSHFSEQKRLGREIVHPEEGL